MNNKFTLEDASGQDIYNYVCQKVEAIVYRALENDGDKLDISPDSNLTEYGLDSVKFIKIVVDIETELEIAIDDEDLDVNKFSTIRNITDYALRRINLHV